MILDMFGLPIRITGDISYTFIMYEDIDRQTNGVGREREKMNNNKSKLINAIVIHCPYRDRDKWNGIAALCPQGAIIKAQSNHFQPQQHD